eukprot:COSAG01_NODE_2086_length_8456_cov_9.203662_2_plen_72_part_00
MQRATHVRIRTRMHSFTHIDQSFATQPRGHLQALDLATTAVRVASSTWQQCSHAITRPQLDMNSDSALILL